MPPDIPARLSTTQELIDRFGAPDDIALDPSNPTNADKAYWGRSALEAYGILVNGDIGYDEPETMASDMIADLMHHLTMIGVDADVVIANARRHFEAEVGRGYDEPRTR